MPAKIKKIARSVNGVQIEQREFDGFINGTAMCMAYGKDISDWLKTDDTWNLVVALAEDLGIDPKDHKSGNSVYKRVAATYPTLVVVKRGSPQNGGGTWIHPDLAVPLAQWCDKRFAIQVSRWVQEWMFLMCSSTQIEDDFDRVSVRDWLKDKSRLELTDQIKKHLQQLGKYNPSNPKTRCHFINAHDQINRLLTGETAKQMRERLKQQSGIDVKESDLLRDYFPIEDLVNYATVCRIAANYMKTSNMKAKDAIDLAVKQALPPNYTPKRIDFTERVALVRQRIQQRNQLAFA